MFIVSVNVLFLSNSQPSVIMAAVGVVVFIVSVNVLFLSNSHHLFAGLFFFLGVYSKCQCPLFKQFTTFAAGLGLAEAVFIVSVNVLFLSNSQPSESIITPK